jgi:hypothetical protein
MLGDPIESRGEEQLLVQIKQSPPEVIAAVAHDYEFLPPIVSQGFRKVSTVDERSGEDVNVDELLSVDDDPEVLTVVFTERAFWPSIRGHEGR